MSARAYRALPTFERFMRYSEVRPAKGPRTRPTSHVFMFPAKVGQTLSWSVVAPAHGRAEERTSDYAATPGGRAT